MSRNSALKTFALQLLKTFLAAVFVVLTSRWLGAGGRGQLSLILFYVNLAMIANEYVGGSSLGNLAASMGAAKVHPTAFIWATLVAIVSWLVFFISPAFHSMAAELGLLVFALGQLTVHYNVYQGLGRVYVRNRLQLALELGKLACLCGIVWFTGVQFLNPHQVVDITLLVTFVVYLASEILLRRDLWQPGRGRVLILKQPFALGFWAQNGQLVQFLNYRLSLVLLQEMTGTSVPVGVYSNVLLIADTIWIFGNSFGTIAHMRMLQSQSVAFRADITLRYAVISAVGTGGACLLLAFLPAGLFAMVFGAEFTQMKSASLWLIPSILSLGASTLFSHYLHAVGKFRSLLACNLAGLAVQFLLAVWLIPRMGLTGACLAADAGFFAILVLVYLQFRRDNPHAEFHGVVRVKVLFKLLLRRFR